MDANKDDDLWSVDSGLFGAKAFLKGHFTNY